LPDELPEPVAAQPAAKKRARIDSDIATRRMALRAHLDLKTLGIVSAKRGRDDTGPKGRRRAGTGLGNSRMPRP
jgi:hypothetical protein